MRLLSPALTIVLVATSIAISDGAAPRATLSLDGVWRFQLAPTPADAGRLASFHAADFDSAVLAAFKPIPVPANWTTHGFEEPHYVNGTPSEGFYLHRFNVPESAAGQRVLLHFDGVWQSAEVWLNGTRLGRHDSGFTGFAFEASKAIKPGAENRLAVRVRQQTPFFKLDANDDWALPGIYRSVWLEFTPADLFLENVEVATDLDGSHRDADLRIRAFVMRNAKADFFALSPPFEVRAILRTTDGAEVQRATVNVVIAGSHNGRDVPLTLRVRGPLLWTAETPNLYDVRVELVSDGKVAHTWEDRIGFREVSTAGGVLRINGQAVKLRGVGRHDEHPDVGRATRREHWLQDIELMKAANINAVRCAHYPPAEGFIRLCDELGLYVLDEIPLGFGGDRMGDPAFAEGVFLRVHETIARDRNCPSVIIWDLGNEDPFSALHLAALRAVKGLDPTRPLLMPFRAEEWLPPEVDILAPHYWKAAEYDALAARATRPIVTTEYTHALGPDDFGELQQRWDALTHHPTGAGAMIWLWADQGLRRSIDGRPVFGPLDKTKYTREGSELVRTSDAGPNEIYDAHGNLGMDGIVDADRTPQIDYWETKATYAPVRVLIDRVAVEPNQTHVLVPIRNDYDFTDLSSITATWKLFSDATELATGEAKLSAAPHTETTLTVPMKAIAANAAAGAHYLHLFFKNAASAEITRCSVRLEFDTPPGPVAELEKTAKPVTSRSGDVVIVTAGEARLTFDATTAAITSWTIGNTRVAQGSDIVVWRKGTLSERNVLDRRPQQRDWDKFLQGMKPNVRKLDVSEAAAGVVITADVEYREDEKNSVGVNYTYTVLPGGGLRVSYAVKPHVEVDALTEIGLELNTGGAVREVTWLGLGPTDSLPNRTSSVLFGQWSATVGSAHAHGTKSGVEWLRIGLDDPAGQDALLVRDIAGFRLARGDDAGDQRLRLLTHLAGAWVKGGPPEHSEWRLDVKDGRVFEGAFEILPAH